MRRGILHWALRAARWTTPIVAATCVASACRKDTALPEVEPGQGTRLNTDYAKPPEQVDASVTTLSFEFSKKALLEGFADCAMIEIDTLVELATDLDAKASALAADTSDENRDTARLAWEATIDQIEVLELFQYGPAAMHQLPGGQELRNELYVWPQFSRCFTDQVLVEGAYQSGALPDQLANARGMTAVEYLLFYDGTENGCPTGNVINSGGGWDALVAQGLTQPRANYAAAAAHDVLARAKALQAAWAPDGGRFGAELASAGDGSQLFATMQDGMNAVNDALFYLDKQVKDWKLGALLGYVECAEVTCTPELPYARRSTSAVRNNLTGFRRVFAGCDASQGIGFDDALVDIGRKDIANDMTRWVETAIAAADAIEEPTIDAALATDQASVETLHAAVRALTIVMKSDFLTSLNLEVPSGIEGDND